MTRTWQAEYRIEEALDRADDLDHSLLPEQWDRAATLKRHVYQLRELRDEPAPRLP